MLRDACPLFFYLQSGKTALLIAASLGLLGCKWTNIGPIKPAQGRELTNDKLAKALARTTTFITKIWDSFKIKDLRADDFILVGSVDNGFYCKPDIGGNIACVRELLAAKADVSAKSKGGKTALICAKDRNAFAIVALIEAHIAATSGHIARPPEAVELEQSGQTDDVDDDESFLSV